MAAADTRHSSPDSSHAAMPGKKVKKGGRGARRAEPEPVPAEFLEDVDKFHATRDRDVLGGSDDGAGGLSGEEDDDVGVYDLDLGSEDDSEDGGADDRLAQLERQEKALRAKLRLQQGEESGESEEEPEGGARADWGAKKGAYYEGVPDESDEEQALEEEEEGRKLQQAAAEALDAADFGAGDSSEEEAGEDEDGPGQGFREEIATVSARGSAGEPSDAADAQELQTLLASLQACLRDVRTRIAPLISQVQEGRLATAEGVSYLEAKNLLLLHYCMNLVFYLLLRAEGRPVRDHPVVTRLFELRTFMEKLRPLDKRLAAQIDRLLSSHRSDAALPGGVAADAEADEMALRPRPGALVPKVGGGAEGDGGGGDGVYRPPKLNPVSMEEDPDKAAGRAGREARGAARKARRGLQSDVVRELAREVHGMPEEVRGGNAGDDSAAVARQRARLEKRAAAEEELMMRVPLGKAELRSIKAARRAQAAGGALLDGFGDEVADLVQASAADGFGNVSQRFGVDTYQEARTAGRSGDAELPGKAPLAERRAKVDNARAKHALALDLQRQSTKRAAAELSSEEEDGAYAEAKQSADSRKKARKAKYAAPEPAPPLEDEAVAGGHRKVSRAVDKNRGLTPHRRKDTKNPRVAGRKKFEKAKIRRKGQVASVKQPTGRYGGEETGIKSKVSKSVRF